MGYLLDTSALSEPLKKQPREAFMRRLALVPSADLYTSSVCIMELRLGCALRGGAALWGRIQEAALDLVRILAFGEAEARRCGELLAALSKQGKPIGIEDAQIAATALEGDLTVVTFNRRHFERVEGLRVEDWLS